MTEEKEGRRDWKEGRKKTVICVMVNGRCSLDYLKLDVVPRSGLHVDTSSFPRYPLHYKILCFVRPDETCLLLRLIQTTFTRRFMEVKDDVTLGLF